MRRRTEALLTFAALGAALLAHPAAAQQQRPAAARPVAAGEAAAPAVDVYRREVFRYQRGGRPDPFQPLLSASELGFRVEDLRLTGIVYSPNARQSVAVFAEGDSARRHRLHVGERLGTMTVLRIYPQRVDVRIDEFGGTRVETIQLKRAERRAAQDAAAAPPQTATIPGPDGQPMTVTVTPTAPAQPAPQRPAPLRRGGSTQAQPQAAQPAPRTSSRPVGGGPIGAARRGAQQYTTPRQP